MKFGLAMIFFVAGVIGLAASSASQGDGTVALESITRSNAVDDHHAIAVNQRRNPTIGPEIAPVDDEDLPDRRSTDNINGERGIDNVYVVRDNLATHGARDSIATEKAPPNVWAIICDRDFHCTCTEQVGATCNPTGVMKRTLLSSQQDIDIADHLCVKYCDCLNLITGEWK